MNRSITILTALLLLQGVCSCERLSVCDAGASGVTDGPAAVSNVMRLSTAPSTKSFSEVTGESLKNTGFYALTMQDVSTTFAPTALVSYDSGRKAYFYSDVYFYPKAGTLDVYASWPTAPTNDSGTMKVNFSQADAGYEADLVVAHASASMPKTDAVALTFNHVLAQVQTKFRSGDPDVDVYVKSCEITSPASGTLLFSGTSWTDISTTESHSVYSSPSGTPVTRSGSILGGILTAIPDTVNVKVTWETREKGTSTVIETLVRNGDIPLTMNSNNVLLLTLGDKLTDDLLDLTVSVNPWIAGPVRDVEYND